MGEWNYDVVKRNLMSRASGIMEGAITNLRTKVIENIAVPGPPRSKRDEYPHIDKSTLITNIESKYTETENELTGTVQTDVEHGYWLEKKQPSHGGRPWLSKTWVNEINNLKDDLNAE